MIFGIPKFEGIFETLPKRKSRQIRFWKFLTFSGIPKLGGNFQKFILAVDCFGAVLEKGTFFGIPFFEGIFETLPKRKSRQIIFWKFLTFSGIPKLGGNFKLFH